MHVKRASKAKHNFSISPLIIVSVLKKNKVAEEANLRIGDDTFGIRIYSWAFRYLIILVNEGTKKTGLLHPFFHFYFSYLGSPENQMTLVLINTHPLTLLLKHVWLLVD